jgi:tetratricopeptide (TPR) repeat protein
MMNPATAGSTELDETELLHLALHAMDSDRHEESMRLLKRTLHAFPASARARYLLGAEHAQIGLYDRAVAEMTEAVRLDPGLTVAHFQLGLLHVTAGRVPEAQAAWLPLDRLAPDDPLRLFKSALLHLVRDEFAACIENLQAGIARNKLNKPLNDDMRRLLADVQNRQTGSGAANADPPPLQIPLPTKHTLLSTYDRNRNDTATD